MSLISTASHSSFELDEDNLDGEDAYAGDVDGDHVDRGDHDDNDDVVSDGGEVDDLHGDCSAWRLSLP